MWSCVAAHGAGPASRLEWPPRGGLYSAPTPRAENAMSDDGPTEQYFRPQELALFKRTAKLFNVYIAVRRINPASLAYIGENGYRAKLVDCKAKTAKHDVTIDGKRYETAGLVVDCDFLQLNNAMSEAFGAGKIKTAIGAWTEFAATGLVAPLDFYADGLAPIRYNHGYRYFTELDRTNPHYGCLRHSPTGQTRGGAYIHADYDLYAVVSPDATENVFVREERLGQPHSRSKHQMDVQNYITAQAPGLVNHGEQDTFKRDLDDKLDVFHPDGATVQAVIGAAAISDLYATLFKGRDMRSAKGDPRNDVTGRWDRV
jgi:hypothetical protein